MARRAAYLLDASQLHKPAVTVAGAYEFMHRTGNLPSAAFLQAMCESFSHMQYDIGVLSKQEQAVFTSLNIASPKGWMTHDDHPIRLWDVGDGHTVAFVFLPSLPSSTALVSGAIRNKVVKLMEQALSQSNLVVALSDWGGRAERDYLSSIEDEPCPDIFLGSGSGSGVVGLVIAHGRVYYVRSYEKGKAVNRISILAWPRKKKAFEWVRKKNIVSDLIVLDDSFTESLIINQIFSKVDLSNN